MPLRGEAGAGQPVRMRTGVLRAAAQAVGELVLPRWCPGCGRPEISLCAACAHEFRHWFRADVDAPRLAGPPGLPTWSAAGYHGAAARVVMAWKSGARPDLAAPVARIGRTLGARLAEELRLDEPPLVVPAPSGRRRRRRGHEVVAPWSRAVADGLGEAFGRPAAMTAVLTRSGGRRHHLGAAARSAERERAIRLRRGVHLEPHTRYVLVDDVVTTGATLAACAAVLDGAVLAAVTLAATPAPRRRPEA